MQEIIQVAHYYGVPVAVDGAQGIVHKKVDVQELDADFYAFSGHKLYGPTGTGVLYGKEKYLEEMVPWQGGGDMISSVSFKKGTTYAGLPLKFEAGTANFIGMVGLGALLSLCKAWIEICWKLMRGDYNKGHERAGQHSRLQGLRQPGTYYGQNYEKTPLFSMSVEGAHPSDMHCFWTGWYCSAVRYVVCRTSAGTLRTDSRTEGFFGLYNTMEELDFFIESLKKALKMLR